MTEVAGALHHPVAVGQQVLRHDRVADPEGAVLAIEAAVVGLGHEADGDAPAQRLAAPSKVDQRRVEGLIVVEDRRLRAGKLLLEADEGRIARRPAAVLEAHRVEFVEPRRVPGAQQREALEHLARMVQDPGLRHPSGQQHREAGTDLALVRTEPIEVGEDVVADGCRSLEEQALPGQRPQPRADHRYCPSPAAGVPASDAARGRRSRSRRLRDDDDATPLAIGRAVIAPGRHQHTVAHDEAGLLGQVDVARAVVGLGCRRPPGRARWCSATSRARKRSAGSGRGTARVRSPSITSSPRRRPIRWPRSSPGASTRMDRSRVPPGRSQPRSRRSSGRCSASGRWRSKECSSSRSCGSSGAMLRRSPTRVLTLQRPCPGGQLAHCQRRRAQVEDRRQRLRTVQRPAPRRRSPSCRCRRHRRSRDVAKVSGHAPHGSGRSASAGRGRCRRGFQTAGDTSRWRDSRGKPRCNARGPVERLAAPGCADPPSGPPSAPLLPVGFLSPLRRQCNGISPDLPNGAAAVATGVCSPCYVLCACCWPRRSPSKLARPSRDRAKVEDPLSAAKTWPSAQATCSRRRRTPSQPRRLRGAPERRLRRRAAGAGARSH